MTGTEPGNEAGSERKTLGPEDIKRVLDALDASDWDEALITVGDVRIAVARNGGTLPAVAPEPNPLTEAPAPAAPAASAAPPAPAPKAAETTPAVPTPAPAAAPAVNSHVVTAPSVGVFWRSPEPGAPPFVELGQHVAPGDTLCIVEVMKLMSHVDAPFAGTVAQIHVDNAASVEHGAPLFTLVPDEG